ncbi:MAG: hypothetical protein ABSA58_19170 [Acetobacteraceae bacterium]|jgi:hypothetical protein
MPPKPPEPANDDAAPRPGITWNFTRASLERAKLLASLSLAQQASPTQDTRPAGNVP